jgi:uncharacterized YigZ family protein
LKDLYLTIQGPAEGSYKEKGSKFLAFAWPVQNEAEINAHLETLAGKYFDARHHCYAWRLGPDGKRYRTNDAGEPNHSAGDPILNAIKSRALFDVLVVVVRYFGGTKLGIPGLIEAYGTAATEALDTATIVERVLTERVNIVFEYGKTADVGRIVHKFGLKPAEAAYGADCRQAFDVRLRDLEAVKAAFRELGVLEET